MHIAKLLNHGRNVRSLQFIVFTLLFITNISPFPKPTSVNSRVKIYDIAMLGKSIGLFNSVKLSQKNMIKLMSLELI